MKSALFIAIFSLVSSAHSLCAMENDALEHSAIALTYYALNVSLQRASRDSDDYKKLAILKDALFPTSFERSHLIAVHARAATLGEIEIRSCGMVMKLSSIGDVYGLLLGFYDFSLDSEDENRLRNDFCLALKKAIGLKQ